MDTLAKQGLSANAPAAVSASDAQRAAMAERIARLFELRAQGEIDKLMELVTEDVVCFPSTTWGYSGFPYTLRGKQAVREAFRERHVNYIFFPAELHLLLIDGDQTVVHRTATIRPRGGGALQSFDAVDWIRFRDGLVCEFTEFCDGSARAFVVNYPF